MIIPPQDINIYRIYQCGICHNHFLAGKDFKQVACSALHPPGSCCHHVDMQIPLSVVNQVGIILNNAMSKAKDTETGRAVPE